MTSDTHMSTRNFTFAAIILLGSLAIALLTAELTVRAIDDVPIFTSKNFVVDMLSLVRANSGVVVHDETLGWRLRDNYEGGIAFSIGEYGVRMNGASIQPVPRGGVLAVGDSFTAGSGVADNESWPAQLERQIGQPVVNAAAGAWGVDQMILRAEQLVPVLNPRVLVVGILAQDSLRNNFEIYGGGYKPYFDIENGTARLKGVPVPRVTERGVDLDLSRRVFGYSYLVYWTARRTGHEADWIANEYRYRQVHPNETGVQISCLLMDRLAALRDKNRLRVIVMMQYGAAESQGSNRRGMDRRFSPVPSSVALKPSIPTHRCTSCGSRIQSGSRRCGRTKADNWDT